MPSTARDDSVRGAHGTGAALAVDARQLRKVYGPTTALADATFQVHTGEIHGLLGENGAGKSTLVRILAGVHPADGGTLQFFGEDAVGGPDERRKKGLAFIHQDLGLFDGFSVAENIALSCGFQRRGRFIDHKATLRRAREIAARIGFEVDAAKLVGELPLADQTLVAVCRALAEGARLIVLDEPTAYLEARQVRRLFELLSRLRDDGVACVIITHRSEDVLHICDRVTVLRDGRDVARREASELSEAELVRLITGRDGEADKPEARAVGPGGARATRLRVHGLAGPSFGPVSFSVRSGEVVGLCGLADSGQFAVGGAVVGDIPVRAGELTLDGVPYRPRSVRDALAAGIGYLPASRAADGLAGELTVTENIFMNPAQPWWKPLRHSADVSASRRLMNAFSVRPAAPERQVSTFSGGNQQKILLAKWLGSELKLAVLNEPSAGVDVGAKVDIHQDIRHDCAEKGTGALVISTDFQEIADLCDHAIVMRRGVIVGEVGREELNAELLTELAYGGAV
jgi:ribose transport system ATP-binding protein